MISPLSLSTKAGGRAQLVTGATVGVYSRVAVIDVDSAMKGRREG